MSCPIRSPGWSRKGASRSFLRPFARLSLHSAIHLLYLNKADAGFIETAAIP